MRLECKRLADKCKGQKFDRQLKGDDDLGIVVTQSGKHEGCIKTCGDNAAIDCGGSSTSLKARLVKLMIAKPGSLNAPLNPNQAISFLALN